MWLGVILGLAASASWAGANVFIQRSSLALGPFRALVWAQVAGGLLLLPVAAVLDHRSWSIDRGVLLWAAVAGLSAVLAYASLFIATARGRLSVVVPVMSSWSIIAAAISLGVLGQTVRGLHLAGAGLVVAGVLVVSAFARTGGDDAPDRRQRSERGAIGAAFGAALGFGVLIPAIDRLAPVSGRLGAIAVVFLLDLVIGVPVALVARVDLRAPTRSSWPLVAAAGALETAGFVWISLGTSRAPVAIVAPLAGLASAFTVLFAWVFLGERPPLPVVLGSAIVCAGVVTLAL